jgi:perosamine synthetase
MIPISIPHLYKEDKNYAIKAIKDNFISQGPNILQFEKKIAELTDRRYAVTCSNGTTALYMAIKALDLPKGSEVILPSMTIISCLTAVLENDLIPVFCDVNPDTWNICFDSVRDKITDNTSALIIVDIYGLIIDVNKLFKFREQYPHILVIEDASEAHGAKYWEHKAGSLGNISTFSFYSNKVVTTGEGGAVMTDDPQLYEKLLSIRNLNFIERKKYIHSESGWNFRLNNLSCSIGIGQIENIDKTIKDRKRIAKRYNSKFKKCTNIQLPSEELGYENVYWYYAIVINSAEYNKLLENLDANGIDYRHFFHPLHKQPFINSKETLVVSEHLYKNGLILPTYTGLKNKDIDFICKIVLETLL